MFGRFERQASEQIPLAISRTEWSACSARATRPDSVSASARGVLSSCLARVNSTISANQSGFGAAIFNGSNGALTLNNDTVSDNPGIGTWNFGRMDIGNSIFRVADPLHDRNFDSFYGTVTSRGYNLSNDAAGGDARHEDVDGLGKAEQNRPDREAIGGGL